MKDLAKISLEELELMNYTDIAYEILKKGKKSINTPTIFKKICELLHYSEQDYEDKIGDFYTSLTIDKRFVLLDNGNWDIRDRHSVELELDDDEDDLVDTETDDKEEETIEEEEEDESDSTDDSEIEGLNIVDDEEADE